MTYQVRFTDNINNTPLTVEDNTVNESTSLVFPGRNTTGYGQIVGENFLHLLENFANSTAPVNPVKGQLWYDSSAGVNQLKIYDGTTWSSAGGLKKGSSIPSTTSSIIGDLWVNTSSQQLFLFTGSSWILVGPAFSEGSRTGSIIETIEDTASPPVARTVLSQYVAGERIAIISSAAFTPKNALAGFSTINTGITLHSNYNTYYGTAEKAAKLIVSDYPNGLSADQFFRKDKTNDTYSPINIRNAAGLSIGEDKQLTLGVEGTSGVIAYNVSGANLNVKINNNGTTKTVLQVNSQERVGINNTAPQEALDVTGNVLTSGTIVTTNTTASTSAITGALRVAGGAGISGNLNVGANLKINGSLTVGTELLPDENLGANLGSNDLQFNRLWVSRVDAGEVYGPIIGDITRSTGIAQQAAKLASRTIFEITGDMVSNQVDFDGQYGTPITTISASGNGTQVTITFAPQTVAPFPTGSQVTVSGIVPTGYRGTYTVINGTTNSVTFANTTTGAQTVEGLLISASSISNTKSFITTLNSSFITDKTEVSTISEYDEFIISRENAGLRKITKANLWNAIPTSPVGSMTMFAGTTAPAGWLLCDGSEVRTSDYPELFSVIGYIYGDSATLIGLGTFKLPDMRGRFPLGLDNMNNGITVPSRTDPTNSVQRPSPANRVTSVEADNLGLGSGSEQNTLALSNLPDHEHDLVGDAGNQYFAFRNISGAPADSNAISGQGSLDSGLGQYLATSGGILTNGQLGRPFSIMNPYLSVNYIIYTGRNA